MGFVVIFYAVSARLMEYYCIEAKALKPSFLVKTNSQLLQNDDVWCIAGINSVSSDDFPVEDLLNLDFPEKDIHDACFSHQEDDEQKSALNHRSSSTFSAAEEFDSLSVAELAVPVVKAKPVISLISFCFVVLEVLFFFLLEILLQVDDVENLEWLSQFVDDSASEHSFSSLIPTACLKEGGGAVYGGLLVEPLSRPVHKKPRSKRSRPHGRPSAAESSSLPLPRFTKPAADGSSGSVSGRRCAHCQVQKTPQWRTGPLGPKTLCNACGVRFKSGRLFPEYRPACSPTFSHDLHSNSHRKVLEMRRQGEAAEGG